jgi:hypothetical protein
LATFVAWTKLSRAAAEATKVAKLDADGTLRINVEDRDQWRQPELSAAQSNHPTRIATAAPAQNAALGRRTK